MPPARQILGPEQIEAYHRDGFVVPPYRLPEKDIAKLQALTLRLIEDNPTLADHHMVGPHVPGSGFEGLKSRHGWLDIATHPDIVDIVEQIVGPDIVLWATGFFTKPRLPAPAPRCHRAPTQPPVNPLPA